MDSHSITQIATLSFVFISAIFGGLVAGQFKLPALLGYIASGVLFGNLLNSWIDSRFLHQIADTGVTLLLFTIGLEFSFYRLKHAISQVLWPGLFQILFTVVVMLGAGLLFHFAFFTALYIGIAAALSSTAIVVKVLTERGEMDTVLGELSMGWLVLQDLAVIPIMILLPAITSIGSTGAVQFSAILGVLIVSVTKSVIALSLIIFLGKIGIPTVLNVVSRLNNREVFLLSIIGIVFISAITTYAVGLSAALGAFIAGLLLSETSQNHTIFSEVRPLRDIFAVVFFVSLGMVLPLQAISHQLPALLSMASFIIVFKIILVFGLIRYLGNHKKTAFVTALGLAQMSEFGFIIAGEGFASGVLPSSSYSFLVALTFISMFAGTALFSKSNIMYYQFYRTLGKMLPKLFPVVPEQHSERGSLDLSDHIIICGFGRVGKYVGRALEMALIPFIVIDYNHSTVQSLKSHGVHTIYGDPAEKTVLSHANIRTAKSLVIAIPDRHTQEMIIGNALSMNRKIKLFCRTHHEQDQAHLRSLGVHSIIQPEFEASLSIVQKIFGDFGIPADDQYGKISRLKIEHGLG